MKREDKGDQVQVRSAEKIENRKSKKKKKKPSARANLVFSDAAIGARDRALHAPCVIIPSAHNLPPLHPNLIPQWTRQGVANIKKCPALIAFECK